MPRMQVYLPEDLYALVKKSGLPASELLQDAVRAELRRRKLISATDRYTAALVAEVGAPRPAERERTRALVERVQKRRRRKTG